MNIQKTSIIISAAIHCFIALLLFLFSIDTEVKTISKPVEITYVAPPKEQKEKTPQTKKTAPLPSKQVKVRKKKLSLPGKIMPKYTHQTMPYLFITPAESLRVWEKDVKRYFKTQDPVPFAGNKYELLDFDFNELYDKALTQDTLKMIEKMLDEAFAEILLTEEQIANLPIPSDLTQEWLFRKQGGVTDMIPIQPLIGLGIKLAQKALKKIFNKKNPEKANLILSDTEIRILNVIWANRTITPSALHQKLSNILNINITSLVSILLDLESKHILIAKRGRREYIYMPVVSKKDVYIYLFSNLNVLEDAEQKNLPVRQELKDAIIHKIKLLSTDTY
ncbi:BlaI/MecI/CopY family transcriptional regulator [bacterium]|nr:BlaI/MecI/CopY family transcriptional regulator [bacterium]